MKKRLFEFLAYLGIGQNKFEKNCGLSIGYINKLKGDMKLDTINKIISTYSELNKDWLMSGEGDMLKNEKNTKSEDLSMSDLVRILDNVSESIKQNAEANKLNAEANKLSAEANERNSRNIEKMLDLLSEKNKPTFDVPKKQGECAPRYA